MPLDWRKHNALVKGGSCNAFSLKDGALLIVPVKPPRDWKRRVRDALEDVRR